MIDIEAVKITAHVKKRWVERIGRPIEDLAEAVRVSGSVPGTKAQQKEIRRRFTRWSKKEKSPTCGIYYNWKYDCLFLVSSQAVVTVMPMSQIGIKINIQEIRSETDREYQLKIPPPSPKPKVNEMTSQTVRELLEAQNFLIDVQTEIVLIHNRRPQVFADVNERREWVKTEIKLVKEMHAGTDRQAVKSAASTVYKELVAEMAAIKPEWKAWKHERYCKLVEVEATTIIREDGGLNYGPAIKHLLAVVEEQGKRIAELEQRIIPIEAANMRF